MGFCSALTLAFASIFSLVSVALLAIAFATDNWHTITVRRDKIKVGDIISTWRQPAGENGLSYVPHLNGTHTLRIWPIMFSSRDNTVQVLNLGHCPLLSLLFYHEILCQTVWVKMAERSEVCCIL
jgi:hypothetical protein